jgi:hypothetical protein
MLARSGTSTDGAARTHGRCPRPLDALREPDGRTGSRNFAGSSLDVSRARAANHCSMGTGLTSMPSRQMGSSSGEVFDQCGAEEETSTYFAS